MARSVAKATGFLFSVYDTDLAVPLEQGKTPNQRRERYGNYIQEVNTYTGVPQDLKGVKS